VIRSAVLTPSGSCCLGSVKAGVARAKKEIAAQAGRGSQGETVAQAGTVLSALVASSCCWLPLVLLALGVSGAGIVGALEVYRPLFVAATVLCLAAAFFFAYRPRKAGPAAGECCAPGRDCCSASSPASKRRSNLMAWNRVMLWVVTFLAVALLFFPRSVGFFVSGGTWAGQPPGADPLTRTTSFTVEGMSCEGCSALVGKVIRDVPGVLGVKVDYDKKRALVSTEACCPAPAEAILQALERAGYRGEVAEKGP
jgi:copper chaperone CopZ